MNQPIRQRLFSGAAGTLALTARRATTLTATRVAMTLILAVLTTVTAWADDVNLTEDTGETAGTAARWYVNMPTSGTNTLTLSDATVTTFKVYDDGGKGGSSYNNTTGNYSYNCDGYLVLTAPTGYVLQLSGSIMTKTSDKLTIYDGSNNTADKLLDEVSSTSSGTVTAIRTINSTNRSMTLYFKSNDYNNKAGLDLTVTLISTSVEFGISVNTATGGSIAASVEGNSVTKAKVNDVVTLTAIPSEGYVLNGISVTNGSSNAVDMDWSIWTNTATFTMPSSAVTVAPTFTNDLTSLSVNMPKTGTKTATIPAGVQSFKVYDDGGEGGNYSDGCDGTLVLTAPEGYMLQLSGNITMYNSADYLTVYNGSTTSDTKLLDKVTNPTTAIAPVISSGTSITLYFYSSGTSNSAGLNLTVTLVDPNADNAINGLGAATGGSVAASVGGSPATKAKVNDVVTLTATPESGYMLSGISVTNGSSNTVAVAWDGPFFNTATFTMPASAVTVTPTFTTDLTSLYINMPKTGTKTFDIPAGVTSFKVYDDGGSDHNYSDGCDGALVLNAPENYVLQLSGNISADGGYDYLHVYDGSTTSSAKLLDKVSSPGGHYGANTVISTVTSSGQSMRLFFHSTQSTNYAGLDLTVTLLSTSTERNITVTNPATGGTVASNKSTAKYEETVTLTATPADGYVLSDVSAIDAIGNTIDLNWNTWTNSATFIMPVYAVTVTPTFTNDLTSLSVNMPKKGTKTATIPAGVTSFKVYDDGGSDHNYSDGCKGYLELTAPTGYVLQLSGNIWADGSNDYLTVYDGIYNGTITSGTILLNRECSTEKTIAPISSTSESMTLYFYSSDQNNYAGLDLTVTLVSNGTEYDVTVNNPTTGGIIAASISGTSVTKALANKTITLTATPESNYLLSDVSVKDESNNAIAVDVNFCNNTATFTMPASAVTIAPTFTNTLTADGGLYINIPAFGSKEVTIPSGVQSFKVYDDGGSGGNYSKNCNGTLILTAPTGYVLQLSGNITTDNGFDLLTVYDGDGISTKLIDAACSSSENTETAITTVKSSGQSMRIFFTSNEYYNYAGLDLTVTVVPITYTVSFQKNNDNATGTMEAQTHTYDAELALTANSFEYTGYTFAGWATSADGDVVYTDEQSVSNLTTTQGANVELFAKWTVTEYTITYDLAGGSVATANPTTYTIESGAITLNNPTKDGYTFAGWTGTGLDAATTTVIIANGSTGDRSYTATWTASTYAVTVTAGENMTKTSGEASQTVNAGDAMTDVVYTANEGYYFPTDYSVDAVNGVSVTRNSYTQITVSGSPTADAEITLTAPTAKTKPAAPTTPAASDCTTAENNDGKLTGVTTDMEYKKSDAESWTDGTGNDITGLTPGTYYVRIKATDTTLASDNQELTIAAFVVPTYTVTVNNGTGSNDYEAGASVTITANDPGSGWQFKEWTGADGLTFTDGSATTATATFTMPSADVTVTATWKKLLTITADSDSKEYDGSTLTKNSYTSEGLLEGDVIESVTITGSQTVVGTSDNVPSAAVIKNDDTDVTANYAITYVNGTLTVTAKQIESESGTIVTQDENGYSVTVDERNGSGAVINGTVLDANGEVSVASLDYDRPLSVPTETDKDVTIGGEPAKLYTTCLPTIPTANANVKYYTLASVSGTTLHFTEVTSPAADTPYLMAVTGSSSVNEDVTASNVTLKKTVTGSTANGYTMMGTQTGLTNSDAKSAASIADNATYILQAGSKWGKVTDKAGVYIPPFRAYITGPKVKASSARQMNSSFGDDDATGIDSIRTTDADGTERWYDLNGRRIAKPNRKGLYIRNGKVTTTTDLTD